MSQADVDLIRGGFDTFADDGLDAILRLMRDGKATRLALFHDKEEAIASLDDQSLRQ